MSFGCAISAQAGTYGGSTGAITSRLAESLLDAAGVRAHRRVLDVATGPGYIAEHAAARGARALGIDLAEGMLELARQRVGGLELLRADAEELPFDDASFDAVVGGFVINHLPHPQRALAEAARVLVSGRAVPAGGPTRTASRTGAGSARCSREPAWSAWR